MTGYLPKPVRARQLFDAIRDTMDEHERPNPDFPEESGGDSGLDWEEARAAVGGDLKLLREIVDAARQETAKQWELIRIAVSRGDTKAARMAAHTIKGSIRYFGETPAYREAYRIEQLFREGACLELEFSLDMLGRTLESVRGELAKYMDETVPGVDH